MKVSVMVSGKALRVVSHVADGTWSSVHYVYDTEMERFAALKITPLIAAVTGRAEAEVETLRQLRHPNVVQYLAHFVRSFHDIKCLCVELEYCAKRTLADCLVAQRRQQGPPSAATVLTFATQLAAALEYLHTQEVLHGDVRPETILVTQDNQLKLSSFGSPLWVERGGRVTRTITGGDRVYAPPEWADSVVPHHPLQPSETPLPSYDMWSMGCVVTELVTLKLLRPDRHCTTALAIKTNTLQEVFDDVARAHSGLFAPLCSKLLLPDADERLSASEARRLLCGLSSQSSLPQSARTRARSRWLFGFKNSRRAGPQVVA
eukprot:EG_transcript_6577